MLFVASDFIAINETLIFPPESPVEDIRCIHIPIIDDTLEENVESFSVFAYAIGPCVELMDGHDQVVVSIIDNDGKTCAHNYVPFFHSCNFQLIRFTNPSNWTRRINT